MSRPVRVAFASVTALLWLICITPTFLYLMASAGGEDRQIGDARLAQFRSPSKRPLGELWEWVDREVHGKTIAFVGDNIPYFLMGRRFENRVVYIPANPAPVGRFHDYARSAAVTRPGPPNTPEPTIDRFVMDPRVWLKRLRQFGVDYFVVHTIKPLPILCINIRHDEEGFPVERQWLDALARQEQADRTSLAQGSVWVYQLQLTDKASLDGFPSIEQSETDALDQMRRDRPIGGAPIRHYPCARAYIERMGLTALDDVRP
jgi:hypothetical protein